MFQVCGEEDVIIKAVNFRRFQESVESAQPALYSLGVQSQQENITAKSAYHITEDKISGFYRRLIELWTDMPYTDYGYNAIDFSIGYDAQNTQTNGYAVDFRDWISMEQRITLIPTYTLNTRDVEMMKDVLLLEETLQAPIYHDQVPLPDHENNIMIARLHELVEKYTPADITNQYYGWLFPHISYRLNHVNKLTDNIIQALDNTLSRGKAKAISYYIHPLTEDGTLYIIEIRLIPNDPPRKV
jgi:hypothetical protein